MGGVEASFQFRSYKVDNLKVWVRRDTATLMLPGIIPDQTELSVRIRNPFAGKAEKIYIGGVDAKLAAFDKAEHTDASKYFDCEIGVAGVFQTIGDELSGEIEEKMAKIQMPALLFPYLRSALTNVLASAGFGSIVLPLVNVQKLAESQWDSLRIVPLGEVVPTTESTPKEQKTD